MLSKRKSGNIGKWRSVYEELNSRYSSRAYQAVFEIEANTILELVDSKYGKLVDIGCGSGDLDVLLAQNSAFNITCVDFLSEFLKQGKIKAETCQLGSRMNFVKGAVYNLPFESETFDIAISTGYESAEAYIGATEEVIRVVKPGELLIFDLVRMPNLYDPLESITRYIEYKREVKAVQRGGAWGEGGLKHWHLGSLGLEERFEEELGLKIEQVSRILTYPSRLNKNMALAFGKYIGRFLPLLLARALIVKMRKVE